MKYQGIIIRAVAYLADTMVLFAIFSILHFLTFGTWFRHVSEFSLSFATHPVCLSFATFYFIYFIILEGLFGATPGKWVVGVRVRQEDGTACGMKKSFIRNLLRLVDGVLFYLVGVIFILKSFKKQRLGDRLAGTVVLKKDFSNKL